MEQVRRTGTAHYHAQEGPVREYFLCGLRPCFFAGPERAKFLYPFYSRFLRLLRAVPIKTLSGPINWIAAVERHLKMRVFLLLKKIDLLLLKVKFHPYFVQIANLCAVFQQWYNEISILKYVFAEQQFCESRSLKL